MGGAAARPLSGENDMAQNPFDLRAEHGPSLFDARHRFVLSSTWEIPSTRANNAFARALLHGWQVNGIATVSSGTPFTVNAVRMFHCREVIRPCRASSQVVLTLSPTRMRVAILLKAGSVAPLFDGWIRKPKRAGLGTPEERRPRPGVRECGYIRFQKLPSDREHARAIPAECFNIANHANFGIPVTDLASANFGRVLDAGPPRLLQFGLKILF